MLAGDDDDDDDDDFDASSNITLPSSEIAAQGLARHGPLGRHHRPSHARQQEGRVLLWQFTAALHGAGVGAGWWMMCDV